MSTAELAALEAESQDDSDDIEHMERQVFQNVLNELNALKGFLPILAHPWQPKLGPYFYDAEWYHTPDYLTCYWKFLCEKMQELLVLNKTIKEKLAKQSKPTFWNFIVLSMEVLAQIRLQVIRLNNGLELVEEKSMEHLTVREQVDYACALHNLTLFTTMAYVDPRILPSSEIPPIRIYRNIRDPRPTIELSDPTTMLAFYGTEQDRQRAMKLVRLRFFLQQILHLCGNEDFFQKRVLKIPTRSLCAAYVQCRFLTFLMKLRGKCQESVVGTAEEQDFVSTEFERVILRHNWEAAIPFAVGLTMRVSEWDKLPHDEGSTHWTKQRAFYSIASQEIIFSIMMGHRHFGEVHAYFSAHSHPIAHSRLMAATVLNHADNFGDDSTMVLSSFFVSLLDLLHEAEEENHLVKIERTRVVLITSCLVIQSEYPPVFDLAQILVWRDLFELLRPFLNLESVQESDPPILRLQELPRPLEYMRTILGTRLEPGHEFFSGYRDFDSYLAVFIQLYAVVDLYITDNRKSPEPGDSCRRVLSTHRLLATLITDLLKSAYGAQSERLVDLVSSLIRRGSVPLICYPDPDAEPQDRWVLLVGVGPNPEQNYRRTLSWYQCMASAVVRVIMSRSNLPDFEAVKSLFHTEVLALEIEQQYEKEEWKLIPFPVDGPVAAREGPGLLVWEYDITNPAQTRRYVARLLAHEVRACPKQTLAYKLNRDDLFIADHIMMFLSGAFRLVRLRKPGFLRIFKKKLPRLAELFGELFHTAMDDEEPGPDLLANSQFGVEGRGPSQAFQLATWVLERIRDLLLEEKELKHAQEVGDSITAILQCTAMNWMEWKRGLSNLRKMRKMKMSLASAAHKSSS